MHQILSPCQHAARRILTSLVFAHPMALRLCLNTAVLVLALLSFPPSGKAAEWSTEPSLRLGEEYNDNIQLTTQSHDSVTGFMVSPKLGMAVSSDIWGISGSAELVRKRYSGKSDLNRDDQLYNVNSSYMTERSTWQLKGSITKVSTLADEKISPDTGFLRVQREQDASSISPSWAWKMTELTKLQLSYSLSRASYVNGTSVGLYDYSARSMTSQLLNQLDDYNQIFVSAGYATYNVPSTTYQSKTATYQAGIIHTFSETSNWTLSAGRQNTSAEQVVPTANETRLSKESSSIFNGSFEKKLENTRVSATLSRALNPSGTGSQVRTDSLKLMLSRPFSPKLTGNFSATTYKVSTQTANVQVVDRRFYQMEPNLRWQWTPELNLDMTYRYVHLRRAADTEAVASSSVYLTLGYQWQKISISR